MVDKPTIVPIIRASIRRNPLARYQVATIPGRSVLHVRTRAPTYAEAGEGLAVYGERQTAWEAHHIVKAIDPATERAYIAARWTCTLDLFIGADPPAKTLVGTTRFRRLRVECRRDRLFGTFSPRTSFHLDHSKDEPLPIIPSEWLWRYANVALRCRWCDRKFNYSQYQIAGSHCPMCALPDPCAVVLEDINDVICRVEHLPGCSGFRVVTFNGDVIVDFDQTEGSDPEIAFWVAKNLADAGWIIVERRARLPDAL